jgi:hypothetical protein
VIGDSSLQDFWDGLLYWILRWGKLEDCFTDEHDIDPDLSLNKVEMVANHTHSVMTIFLYNVNLPLNIRYKKKVLVYGIIPGPRQSVHLNSFLCLLV